MAKGKLGMTQVWFWIAICAISSAVEMVANAIEILKCYAFLVILTCLNLTE